MNKKILTLGLLLFAGLGATAQVSLVNPVPQEVEIKDSTLFDAPAQWCIKGSSERLTGYIYDALLTAAPEVTRKADFKVTIGIRGDRTV